MANLVLLPQIGISEESAVLTRWFIKEGSVVSVGDKLFELETGKSVFEVESEYSGTVIKLLASQGDEIPVQTPVCAIGQPGETFISPAESVQSVQTQTSAPSQPAPAPATMQSATESASIHGVSPRAKALAAVTGVDPSQAVPTGAEGRVIERDVRKLANELGTSAATETTPAASEKTSAQPEAEYHDESLTKIRKTIAANMTASLAQTAQLTHTASFDASNILEYRKLLKQDPETSGITLTDMILFTVTRTLLQFPALNAWLTGDTMRYFSAVNLACAVDTERGLMVPVIFNASEKTLAQISQELKDLAASCRNSTINPNLLTGGSFTVSNLGSYGIESFTPILNAPQTGILGVNTITERVRTVNGVLTSYPCMTLSLTYDHRAVDGAPASAFLKALCDNLEQFTVLLARG